MQPEAEAVTEPHPFKVMYIMGQFAKQCRVCFKEYKSHDPNWKPETEARSGSQ